MIKPATKQPRGLILRRTKPAGAEAAPAAQTRKRAVAALLAGVALAACQGAVDVPRHPRQSAATSAVSLKLATWNLEWLIAPRDFKTLRARCDSATGPATRAARAIPCDVGYKLERSHADFAALARYARELNADVVALQEADGPSAARLVFPQFEFCFTGRPHPQNNGFAVRKGLPHRCEADFIAIAAGDGLRRGAVMRLFPGEPREITLMSVHLKSGCPSAPLDSASRACRALATQLPQLARWSDEQRRLGRRFAILGDLNRQAGPALASLGLRDAGEGGRFQNCFPGQMHTGYIDHILLDPSLLQLALPRTFEHLTYRVLDAHRRKLSDHCPMAIRLSLQSIAFD